MNINNTAFKSQQTFSNTTNQESKCCYSILIVEDDEDLLQFISKRLEYQYTIYKTTNGIEAIKVLQKKLINLVISDIMMPEMDGFELCCKIKKDTEFSHIPVILLTAKTNVQSKITGLECGADAYIEKPFSIEHLQAQIHNCRIGLRCTKNHCLQTAILYFFRRINYFSPLHGILHHQSLPPSAGRKDSP